MTQSSDLIEISGPLRDAPPRARRRGRTRLLSVFSVIIALLFCIPAATVVYNLLLPQSEVWSHLVETVLPDYIANTIWLAVIVGTGVIAIGVSTAWLVTMCRFPGRDLLEWALILPLAVPAYVMAYAYTDFLQYSGPLQTALRDFFGWQTPRDYWFPDIHSVGGAATMLFLVLYPYVYLLTRAAFLQQSACALEVSRTLGCSPWSAFLRVAVPLARPSIVAGTTLALMETLADFGTVQYFGVPTFTTGIYRAWFSMYDQVAAAQLAAILLGFVFICLLLERLSRGQRRFHHTTNRYQHLPEYKLRGGKALLSTLTCCLPVVFGFLLPAGLLLNMALSNGLEIPKYLPQAYNTFILGAITAVLAVALAMMMAYSLRIRPTVVSITANRIAGLGYAIPGSVIGVGILLPFTWLDNTISGLFESLFGFSTGLLLTGGIAAIVFAYLVRFLAVSLQAVEAGFTKVRPSMEDAARSLGHGPFETLAKVHAPLMWGSLLTAGLLVFVDVMKELPATLIMRPFNFDTLAITAHNFASDERLGHAATPALMIVSVGLLPVIILSRAIARSRPGRKGAFQ
ncbi:ABC transporter permease [Fodinicurvata sediminis]|uniref:ABC transporter permease n=1 Tax=Fodinicurvata sediminis TaxID=1121832 RepID=UPI0003B6DB21|nr:iron ABC transporter permease [Fodinicurvata sediminis]